MDEGGKTNELTMVEGNKQMKGEETNYLMKERVKGKKEFMKEGKEETN